MRKLLLSTSAIAALLAMGTMAHAAGPKFDGIQMAQASGGSATGERSPAGRPATSAPGGAGMNQAPGAGAPRPSTSGQGSRAEEAPGARRDEAPGARKNGTSGSRASEAPGSRKDEAPGQRSQNQKSGTTKSSAEDSKSGSAKSSENAKSDSNTTRGAGQKSGEANQSGQTTGQGAAGSTSVNVSNEQRTRVVQHFRSDSGLRRVNNVNFAISVGTVVPQSVTYYDLPPTIVSVVPAWRSYKYIAVGGEILIIDPQTRRIVLVLNV